MAASRTKQMALAFFDDQGLVDTNNVPRGLAVNTEYIVGGSTAEICKGFPAEKALPGHQRVDFCTWTMRWSAPHNWCRQSSIQLNPTHPTLRTWSQWTFLVSDVEEGAASMTMTLTEFNTHDNEPH